MKGLIIGAGQIGTALYKALKDFYPTRIRDKNEEIEELFDILHICFPYSKDFIEDVKDYQEIYRARYTVIHSTVPVGVSRQCQAFHSPVRGKHPHLEKSLKKFVKYLAPPDRKLKEYFEKTGIEIKLVKKSETTEALKLWDTTQYGWNIILEKEIYQWCKENKVDFNIVYTDANKTYNKGYEELENPQFKKYILKHIKGQIGGHCILQNCDLLPHQITKIIKKLNKKKCNFLQQ